LLATCRGLAVMAGAVWLGSVDHYLGMLHASLGRNDQAAVHFEAAARSHRQAGARPWLALTQREWPDATSVIEAST
jgi:hypothetical protein